MKHRYNEKDQEIIKAARKAHKDKQVERRLKALELQAAGKMPKKSPQQPDFIQHISVN